MTAAVSVLELDPARYVAHALHADTQAWKEKNCYADVLIEAVHALGLDPIPMLAFTLTADWEGDQWTFFKPSHEELRVLYGLNVQELNLWRPLIEHVERHVRDGKLVMTEADSFYLPDTKGTDYRHQHVKTTIIIETLDRAQRRVGYFHNAGYYAAEGEDFDGLFRTNRPPDPEFLPLFVEFIRCDGRVARPAVELAALSRQLLNKHVARLPKSNPITRFRDSFTTDIEWLKTQPPAMYHGYAFATLRQLGAAYELGGQYLAWLEKHEGQGLADAARHCLTISETCKALILKAARAVTLKKAADFSESMIALQVAWDAVAANLRARYGAGME